MRSLLVISIVLVLSASVFAESSKKIFTAQNLWYESPIEMSCINFKIGSFLPAGTEVDSYQVLNRPFRGGERTDIYGISFKTTDGDNYFIQFEERYHPKFELEDYANVIFTDKSFSELTNGLTERELYAIKRGILLEGMRKNAVLISYGKPAEHYTPNIDADTWYYWTQRNIRKEIYFDEDGKTMDVL
ncbi:MAG: hypothetical protein WDA20_02070 [Desulfuromonadales bacterium]